MRPDWAALIAEHEGCVANDSRSREWIDGSGVTGFDVWSCGIEIPFTDDFDEMGRLHLAAVLDAALDAWLGADETRERVAFAALSSVADHAEFYRAEARTPWRNELTRAEAALATLTDRSTP